MAQLKFNGIGIKGISACVPSQIVVNRDAYQDIFEKENLEKTISTIGIEERRITDTKTCTSDLCYKAADELIRNMNFDKSKIDVIIFVSQTPDYKLPATACLLQNRLGLAKGTIAFDVNLGCSGYVYGLYLAYSFLQNEGINNVLLFAGDTPSKTISFKDKATNLLFGDAGTATIVGRSTHFKETYISLYTDGLGDRTIILEAGQCRVPSTIETLTSIEMSDGSIRSLENTTLDGGEVFNFTIREVPNDIKGLLDFSGIHKDNISFFIFHQANKFMLDFLAKKIKIPTEKFPTSLLNFGNTSSASIPLTIVNMNENAIRNSKLSLLSGFGVGLSWGSVISDISTSYINPLIEY